MTEEDLTSFLLSEEEHSRKITQYFWYFLAACFLIGIGYMAGMYQGYHQALADFGLIKGIVLSV